MTGLIRGYREWRTWEAPQLAPLIRNTLRGFLENELTSAEGNPLDTLAHVLALLASGGICLTLILLCKYYFLLGNTRWQVRWAASWPDQEFLISLSMAVTAFATVLTWDSLFPDRRDSMILASLPARMRTVLVARVLSILLLPSVCVVAINGLTVIAFPPIVLGENISWASYLRFAFAHVVSLSAAGLFAFFSLLALQGLLVNVLTYRQFRWVSTWVQFGVLLVILSLFLMMPDIAHPSRLVKPENLAAALWLPPLWFLGLYQTLLGSGESFLAPLARSARLGLAAAALGAALAYGIGYPRHVRKAIEEAELAPGRRGRYGFSLVLWLLRSISRNPTGCAVFAFVARTMRRNRKQRLLLAISCTVGLAYVFEGVAAFVHVGGSSFWARPSAEAASIPLIFSFFLLVGMRVLFTMPVELNSNWIFRITESGRPEDYLSGVRKVMLLFCVAPVTLAPFPLYTTLWGWRVAFQHVVMITFILWVVVEKLLKGFDKIPFTCSFLPGHANLKVKFGLYWMLFTGLSFGISHIEPWLLYHPVPYLLTLALLGAWLARQTWNRRRPEAGPPGFVYEQRPEWAPITLELRQ